MFGDGYEHLVPEGKVWAAGICMVLVGIIVGWMTSSLPEWLGKKIVNAFGLWKVAEAVPQLTGTRKGDGPQNADWWVRTAEEYAGKARNSPAHRANYKVMQSLLSQGLCTQYYFECWRNNVLPVPPPPPLEMIIQAEVTTTTAQQPTQGKT